jgi:hypothetical protein
VSEGGGGVQEKQVERRGLGTEAGAIGVREVGAASNGDSIRQPNGGPMLPEELRPSDLRQVKASCPGSSSPRPAKYLVVRRWARM